MRGINAARRLVFSRNTNIHAHYRQFRAMTQVADTLEHGQLPNTCQYTAQTDRGEYLIQVAWPLCWGEDRKQPDDDAYPVSTFYLVDGNAFFFSAVDISRRLEFTDNARTVVVGVGYPPSKYIFDWRRGTDMTPPSKDGTYEPPIGGDGKPFTGMKFGDASKFLHVIQNDIMTYVNNNLFPTLRPSRSALFGHSFGGLFTLNALFTQPKQFDTFIAASPSISFNNKAIAREQEVDFRGLEQPVDPAPSLIITWGSDEQDLERRPGESDEDFEKRKKTTKDTRMRDDALAMVGRLEKCPSIRSIYTAEFMEEDHGSAGVVALGRGLKKFLVDKM